MKFVYEVVCYHSIICSRHSNLIKSRYILIFTGFFLATLLPCSAVHASIEPNRIVCCDPQDPFTILLDNKLVRLNGKSVRSLFLVPVGKSHPVILINSNRREPGAAFVKWELSAEDSDLVEALLDQGLSIRVIAADQVTVGAIKKESPNGMAIFNKKDVRGRQIKARENI